MKEEEAVKDEAEVKEERSDGERAMGTNAFQLAACELGAVPIPLPERSESSADRKESRLHIGYS